MAAAAGDIGLEHGDGAMHGFGLSKVVNATSSNAPYSSRESSNTMQENSPHACSFSTITPYFFRIPTHTEDIQMYTEDSWTEQLLDSWAFHWLTAIVGLAGLQHVYNEKVQGEQVKM
ncbi:hypothetical protein STEG23_009222 [Scotinomys teguina]